MKYRCYVDNKPCECTPSTLDFGGDWCVRDPFRAGEPENEDEEVTHLKYLNGITDEENLYG